MDSSELIYSGNGSRRRAQDIDSALPKPGAVQPSRSCKMAWTDARLPKSLGELREKRRQANLPDPSYDLREDGIIGNAELFFASLYDADRDGKLNHDELQQCREALENGIEKERILFPNGPHRITDLDRDNMSQKLIQHLSISEKSFRSCVSLKSERNQEARIAAESFLERRLSINTRWRAARSRPVTDHRLLDLAHPDSNTSESEVANKVGEGCLCSSVSTRSSLLQQRSESGKRTATDGLIRLTVRKPKDTICLGAETSPGRSSDHVATRSRQQGWIEKKPAPDLFKAQHSIDRSRIAKRTKGMIGRMPAPELLPPSKTPTLRQLPLLHGVPPAAFMSYSAGVQGQTDSARNERFRLGEIQRADLLPMYSSFTGDHIFREPRYAMTKKMKRVHIAVATPDNLFEQWITTGGQRIRSGPSRALPIHKMNHGHDMVEVLAARASPLTRCLKVGAIRTGGFRQEIAAK